MTTTHANACLLLGCRRAWDAEVRERHKLVHWACRRMGALDPAEIAQRVWEVALSNRIRIRVEERSIVTWLCRIVRNAIWGEINYHRQRAINARRPWVDRIDSPQEHASEEREAVTFARQLLAGCTPSERRSIVAVYYRDLSHDAAASALGISTHTLKSTLKLARSRMRSRVALDASHIIPSRLQAISHWPETSPSDRAETVRRSRQRQRRGTHWRSERTLTIKYGATAEVASRSLVRATITRLGRHPQPIGSGGADAS